LTTTFAPSAPKRRAIAAPILAETYKIVGFLKP